MVAPMTSAEGELSFGQRFRSESSSTRFLAETADFQALEVENARLRRLITDLLLEKVALEDALREKGFRGRLVKHS